MANPIQLKRSTTSGNVPSSLAPGELAVNIPDRLGFILDGAGVTRLLNLTSDAEKVAAGPIYNALSVLLNATSGNLVQSPTAPGSGMAAAPFSSDDLVPARIHRMTDRAFLGPAVINDGKGSPATKDWLEALIPGTVSNGQISVLAARGNAAVVGGSRSSDAMYPAAEGAMGTHGGSFFGLNNNPNYGQSVDAVYAEARNYNGAVAVITANYTTNGTLINGSTQVYYVSNGVSISPGSTVTGTGIPANTTVTASTGSGVTLSNAATVSGSQSLTFTPVTITTNGTTTNGSTYVFGVNNAVAIPTGATVTGTGIQSGTIVSVATGQEVLLSKPTTASGTVSLSFSGGQRSVGYTHDVEVNLINLGSFVQLNPYETVKPGHTKTITSAPGRPELPGQVVSCGLEIQYNGQAYHTGILFGAQGIVNGGHAIAMAQGHALSWFTNNSRTVPVAQIRSDITVPCVQGGQKQVFTDTALLFQTTNAQNALAIFTPVAAINGVSITPGSTGVAPILAPIGSDTNIDLALTPKGNATLQFNVPTTQTVSAGSGTTLPSQPATYLAVRVNGTVVKIPCYN